MKYVHALLTPTSVWSDGWKWNHGQIFCHQDYSLEGYKLQHWDCKLEALAVEISPVSARVPAFICSTVWLPEILPGNFLSRIFCQIWWFRLKVKWDSGFAQLLESNLEMYVFTKFRIQILAKVKLKRILSVRSSRLWSQRFSMKNGGFVKRFKPRKQGSAV